jgi:hypothetical protein
MKVTFVNASQASWFAYYGLDPTNKNPVHLVDALGNLMPNAPSPKPTDALAIPVLPSISFEFPRLIAARLYVSVGKPLLLSVAENGLPQPPNAADPNDPNYDRAWDFFEVTYIPSGLDGLFNFNLSNVQSANLPLSFHVTGKNPSTGLHVDYSRGWLPGGYNKFLTYLRANTDFRNLILPNTQRVLAPHMGISVSLFSGAYLDKYIDDVWTRFESNDLTFVGDPPPSSNTFVNWTGRVQNCQFTFTTRDLQGLVPIVLKQPTTYALFANNLNEFCSAGCEELDSLQSDYANQLRGTLCAAFNRSVMLTTTTLANAAGSPWCKATGNFYQDPITNHYSKAIHANTIDGLAYALQTDDHCDMSSYVSVLNPEELTITFEAL